MPCSLDSATDHERVGDDAYLRHLGRAATRFLTSNRGTAYTADELAERLLWTADEGSSVAIIASRLSDPQSAIEARLPTALDVADPKGRVTTVERGGPPAETYYGIES